MRALEGNGYRREVDIETVFDLKAFLGNQKLCFDGLVGHG